MNAKEFSNEFDVLYNNIMSNQAPGLDEYEKSVFLTKAQDDILKAYFDPRGNKLGEGFDDTPRRQVDFSNLIVTKTLQPYSSTNVTMTILPTIVSNSTLSTAASLDSLKRVPDVASIIEGTNNFWSVSYNNTSYGIRYNTGAPTSSANMITLQKGPGKYFYGGYSSNSSTIMEMYAAFKIFHISKEERCYDRMYTLLMNDQRSLGVVNGDGDVAVYPSVAAQLAQDLASGKLSLKVKEVNSKINFVFTGGKTNLSFTIVNTTGITGVNNLASVLDELVTKGTLSSEDIRYYFSSSPIVFVSRFAGTYGESPNTQYYSVQNIWETDNGTTNPYDNDSLLVTVNQDLVVQNLDQRGQLFNLPKDLFLVINEQIFSTDVTTGKYKRPYVVVPLRWDEYNRLMNKPYQGPTKNQVWRLIQSEERNTCEIIGYSPEHYSYKMRYLRRPRPIILTPLADTFGNLTIDGYNGTEAFYTKLPNGTGKDIDFCCELPSIIHYDILQRAVELAKAAYTGDLNSQIALGSTSGTEKGYVTKSN